MSRGLLRFPQDTCVPLIRLVSSIYCFSTNSSILIFIWKNFIRAKINFAYWLSISLCKLGKKSCLLCCFIDVLPNTVVVLPAALMLVKQLEHVKIFYVYAYNFFWQK